MNLNGWRIYHARGKVLGGSSSINGMIFQRGNPLDDDPFRGKSGPLVLERGPATGQLFGAFFAAVSQAGYHLTDDVNGYRQEGFAASVMPYVTNGNIYAPIMMTAEKAADVILGNTPLAPEPAEFYRRDRTATGGS